MLGKGLVQNRQSCILLLSLHNLFENEIPRQYHINVVVPLARLYNKV